MSSAYRELAPYFRNGRLYVPQRTLAMLVNAGLDRQIAEVALSGFDLDRQRNEIATVSYALENILATLEADTQEFAVLNSDETRFLLTGKPAAV
jgi:hypothetical protein